MTGYIIAVISVIISVFLGYKLYKANHWHEEVVLLNKERQQYNEAIEKDIESNNKRLEQIKNVINTQNTVLQSLNATSEKLRQGAEKRAQEEYEAKSKELQAQAKNAYERAAASYNEQLAIVSEQLKVETEKLSNLQAKQLAYIQAQQRQEQIDQQQDYYRLVLDELDINDIELLREIQKRLGKKEAIDKVIYETYYRPAYDILMSHLFQGQNNISGIYKITSIATGKAYIGQSVNIKERLKQHIKSALTYGPKTNILYQEMYKYGPHDFIFEVLESVSKDQLNERETYWIEFYHTKTDGMNKTKGGS